MDNHYMKLTRTDQIILDSYKSTVDGLGLYLGEGYEIVLHSLENLNESAIKVVHGYHSGRKEGAPITDLALKMLSKIESDYYHKPLSYFNKSKDGCLMKSATIPITGENKRIIGLLCLNFYANTPLSTILESFLPMTQDNAVLNTPAETFSENIDDLIVTSLSEAKEIVYHNPDISSSNKNKEIISILYQKGIFNLKDAVIKVATHLNISKNTVYMHIRNLNTN